MSQPKAGPNSGKDFRRRLGFDFSSLIGRESTLSFFQPESFYFLVVSFIKRIKKCTGKLGPFLGTQRLNLLSQLRYLSAHYFRLS
ncbi:MAG: hypothetical protein ACR2RB_05475 [Gammaproteobacteria bacterium]